MATQVRVEAGIPYGEHGQTLDVWRSGDPEFATGQPLAVFFHGGGWTAGSSGFNTGTNVLAELARCLTAAISMDNPYCSCEL